MIYRSLLVAILLSTALFSTASLAEQNQSRDPMTLKDLNAMSFTVGLSKKANSKEGCSDPTCLKSGDEFSFDLTLMASTNYGIGLLHTVDKQQALQHSFPVSFEIEYGNEAEKTLEAIRLMFFDSVNSSPPAILKRMTLFPISGDSVKCSSDLELWSDRNFTPGERDRECSDATPLVYWKIEPLAVPEDSKIGSPDSAAVIVRTTLHPEDGQGTGKGTD